MAHGCTAKGCAASRLGRPTSRLETTPQGDSHEEDTPEYEDRRTLEEKVPPSVDHCEATANDDQQAERGLPERAAKLELYPPDPCGQKEEHAK